MIPLRKLGDDAEKVSVGDTVEVDDKRGIIRYIGSGRVQIDYNHRFAGKTILYEINVKKSLDADDEKISAILKSRMPVDDDKLVFKKTANSLDVTIPEEMFRAEGLAVIKHFVQMDIFKFSPSIQKINFIETYDNKQASKSQEKQPEKKPEVESKTK